ncbi:MAG: FAD-binding protein [Deltaproteobacteria bacterium]|nr:FAD-binding protein [Deltaproteobacteria bacterium]
MLARRDGRPVAGANFDEVVQITAKYTGAKPEIINPLGIICPPRFGTRLLQALWQATPKARVAVWDRTMVLDLVTDGGRVAGLVCLDLRRGTIWLLKAGVVVLAAGGAGNVFSLTTNPRELTGDGYALAYRAGAALDHMEFIQYVALTVGPIRGYFLLTSLLMQGELLDEEGARFQPPGEVASASPVEQKQLLGEFMGWIAARKRARPPARVFWDGQQVGKAGLEALIPKSYRAFLRRGHDLGARPVEIDLGAHQFLGGVLTDLNARSTLPNLFAAGDVADSIQGADRINGTGIMEALVFGSLAGTAAATSVQPVRPSADLPAGYARRATLPPSRIQERRRWLSQEMDPVLAVRSRETLRRLAAEIEGSCLELEADGLVGPDAGATRQLHELRSLLTSALLVVRASLAREEDLGLFRTVQQFAT